MYILAIDTACGPCSVALYDADRELAMRCHDTPAEQAEKLVPMIEAVLEEGGIGYDKLALMATTIGPGSFTGVRIGLATARGIALAANLPLMGITTLDCMAFMARDDASERRRVLAVVQDARRDQFYFQCFDRSLAVLDEPVLMDADEMTFRLMEEGAGGVTVIADNWKKVTSQIRGESAIALLKRDVRVDASWIAQRAYARCLDEGHRPEVDMARHVRPLYIRPPDAKLPQAPF